MREIKFRVWTGEKMLDWDYLYYQNSLLFLKGYGGVIPMQYTGITDKNGKEIYEGDVYKSRLNTKFPYTKQIVRWDTLNQAWLPKIEYSKGTMGNSHLGEIVGNIYENPELFKP